MLKTSVAIAVVVGLLMAQTPPEPTQIGDHHIGPFANSGQAIIAVIIILVNAANLAYTNWMANQREARKEQMELERRKLDMEERREAREELRLRLQSTHKAVETNTDLTVVAAEAAKQAALALRGESDK